MMGVDKESVQSHHYHITLLQSWVCTGTIVLTGAKDLLHLYTLIERDVIDVYREDRQIGLAY
jgi:hypothetical protein